MEETVTRDDKVDAKITEEWKKFQEQLSDVEEIQVPRWCHYEENDIDIHGFCDASERAHGAVVYSKVTTDSSTIRTLLQAKAKVSPTKTKVTLARLELCATVPLLKLITKVTKALKVC